MGTAAQANVMVVQNVYERLVWYDRASTQPIPWLATGWEVKDGGKRYVFKLRKGIKFHDGTEFDARAVKFSFDRAVLIDDPTGIGSFFPTGTAAPGILKGAWEFSKSFGVGKDYSQAAVDRYMAAGAVRVIDPLTVEFNLAQPYGAFITDLATFMGSIVSPAYALANWTKPTDPAKGFIPGVTAGQRDEWMLYNAAGTGPYRLESFDKATANVVLKANGGVLGWTGRQHQAEAPDRHRPADAGPGHASVELEGGRGRHRGHLHGSDLRRHRQEEVDGRRQDRALIPGVSVPGQYPWLTVYFAKMNLKIKNPDGTPAAFQPFQDMRVRKAFASALDTADIRRNVFNGFAEPMTWGLTPAQFGYDPNVKIAYSFNLDQAKKLLLDAGKDLGFGPDKPKDLSIIYNASAPWQGYIATQLAANIAGMNVGLRLDVKPLSFSEYVNSWRSQLTSFSIHSSFSLTADPNSWLSAFGTGAGFWARTNSYNNPKADDLYTKQFQALEPKRRTQLISELMQVVNDDVIWVWIGAATAYGQPTFNPNVLRSTVKGFYYNPTYQGFYFPALWKE